MKRVRGKERKGEERERGDRKVTKGTVGKVRGERKEEKGEVTVKGRGEKGRRGAYGNDLSA